MTLAPTQFSETFGGLVLFVSIFAVMLAFGVCRDRHPRFSAIALVALGIGLLSSSHWLLIRSPGDSLDRILTGPIGALLLAASLLCLAWGYRRLRTSASKSSRSTPTVRVVPPAEAQIDRDEIRTPAALWFACLVIAGLFTFLTVYGPFATGVWYGRKSVCQIPADLPCTALLLGLGLAVGFLAGLLLFIASKVVLQWLRQRRQR